MSGAIPLLLLYNFMALAGTAVSLFTFPEGTNGNMVVPFHFVPWHST